MVRKGQKTDRPSAAADSDQTATNQGERGRFRLSRGFPCGRMMIENPANGDFRLEEKS